MKKSELHTIRQVITANWLIAFYTWLVEIIREVLTMTDSTKIIHNPYLKCKSYATAQLVSSCLHALEAQFQSKGSPCGF